MATGAQHYQRAEGLLENAWTHVGIDGPLLHSAEVRLALVASAQVHATLALTAATLKAAEPEVVVVDAHDGPYQFGDES